MIGHVERSEWFARIAGLCHADTVDAMRALRGLAAARGEHGEFVARRTLAAVVERGEDRVRASEAAFAEARLHRLSVPLGGCPVTPPNLSGFRTRAAFGFNDPADPAPF